MADETQTPTPSSSDGNTTNIGGNVTAGGDFVGRDMTVQGDQVSGDKVAGRKITADNRGVAADEINSSNVVTGDNNTVGNTVIIQRLDSTDARNQRNHKMLRQMVRRFWVDGFLKHSLYNEVLIRLNMEERPKAVENRPWDLILKQPGQPDSTLLHGLPIIDIFDRMNQQLLILGEPGSGKTTTLLELADELLQRAQANPTHPTPVVFNLSSWSAQRQPLSEWLLNELFINYRIPKKVAQQWIGNDELQILLDGLDEVQKEHRENCVKAIIYFRQEHLVPMVVCSRTNEYEDLVTKFMFLGEVTIQPLTLTQVDKYFGMMVDKSLAQETILYHDTNLRKMISVPLFLNIIAITYHGKASVELQTIGSMEIFRHALFEAYVCRMFAHRNTTSTYLIRHTLYWLSWLASRMKDYSQTVFFIEELQPIWATSTNRSKALVVVVMLLWGPLYGITFGLVYGVVWGGLGGLMLGWISTFSSPMQFEEILLFSIISMFFVTMFGVMSGIVVGTIIPIYQWMNGKLLEISINEPSYFGWKSIRNRLRLFHTKGIAVGIAAGVIDGFDSGLPSGIATGVIFGILFGLFFPIADGFQRIKIINPSKVSRKRIKDKLLNSIFSGLAPGLLYGLIVNGIKGTIFGAIIGLIVSIANIFLFESEEIMDIPDDAVNQVQNQGIKLLVIYILFYGGIAGIISGITILFYGGLIGDGTGGIIVGTFGAFFVGLLFGIVSKGDVVAKHCLLRLILWWKGYCPWNYSRFLNYATTQIFLRKVGRGYVFVHRMFLEHFANMTKDEIERIAATVEAERSQ